jgi:hypothetical protein
MVLRNTMGFNMTLIENFKKHCVTVVQIRDMYQKSGSQVPGTNTKQYPIIPLK